LAGACLGQHRSAPRQDPRAALVCPLLAPPCWTGCAGRTSAPGRDRPNTLGRTNGRFPTSHAPDLPLCYRQQLPGRQTPMEQRSQPEKLDYFVRDKSPDR
jgi:hypothetical protein